MPIYLRPASLKSALAALAQGARAAKGRSGHPLTVLAGGTDIYPTRAARQAWLEAFPRDFLDITHIPELKGIRPDGRALSIGATTSWTEIVAAPLPPPSMRSSRRRFKSAGCRFKIAARSAATSSMPLRRRMACRRCSRSMPRWRSPRSAASAGCRLRASFAATARPASRATSSSSRSASRPHAATARSVFLKLGARSHLVISIVSVALLIDQAADGTMADIRITIGAVLRRADAPRGARGGAARREARHDAPRSRHANGAFDPDTDRRRARQRRLSPGRRADSGQAGARTVDGCGIG